MSSGEEQEQPPPRTFRGVVLGAALLIAALGAALAVHLASHPRQPSPQPASSQRQSRPIVQIVREQPGLPDLSDTIDRLCPSIAVIVGHGSSAPGPDGASAPAFAYSSDGWLVTSAADLPEGPLEALFGDGHRTDVSEVRTDPVSGLAIVRASAATAAPLALGDQAFPRVGQFLFGLTTPAGTGCSASASMIGSDFLADGGGLAGYVRLSPPPDGGGAGTPLFGADGRVVGIGTGDPAGAAIPAPIASVIVDELIRNSPSPSTRFGFRVIDYAAPFSTRLGDVRSGAGVALVQPKSVASKSGLQAGDVVIAVDDVPVSSASELNRALDAVTGKSVLTVQRQAEQLKLTVRRSAG